MAVIKLNESKLSNIKLIMNLLRDQGFECVLNREGKIYVYASKDQIENTFDEKQLSGEIWDKIEITPHNVYTEVSLIEDTVKKSNGKWTNRGDDGTEHGEFKTKKQADAQRRAMYANRYKGESTKKVNEELDYIMVKKISSKLPSQVRDTIDSLCNSSCQIFKNKDSFIGYLGGLVEGGIIEEEFADYLIEETSPATYTGSQVESLEESYYDGKAERYEIEDAYEKLKELLDLMEENEIESIQTEPNTYRIGIPYLQTRSGFIDLTNIYKYTDDSEEDYEYESLSESISVGDRVYHVDDDPQTRVSGVVEEIYEDGDALVSFMDRDSGEVDYATVPIDKLENIDYEYESLKEGITEIRSKKVEDDDGFETDYTMYKDSDGSYFFMFGDKDFYPPERSYSDYECYTEDEANEWFDSYSSTGCYEDEYEDGYEYESLTESEEDTNEDPLDLAQMSFESGHYFDRRDFGTDDDYEEYMSYIQLGPEGFYDEFRDELDFSQTFIDEYGDVGDFGYED